MVFDVSRIRKGGFRICWVGLEEWLQFSRRFLNYIAHVSTCAPNVVAFLGSIFSVWLAHLA